MKKIIIGRGRSCQIRLEDDTDTISRRQAVITVSFFGKMCIYDTSSHGTYVNGERVLIPDGRPITRQDKVNFCNLQDLDWSLVRDPYHRIKVALICTVLAIVIVGVSLLSFSIISNNKPHKTYDDEDVSTTVDDTSDDTSDDETIPINTTVNSPTTTQTSTQKATSPRRTSTSKNAVPKSKRSSKSKNNEALSNKEQERDERERDFTDEKAPNISSKDLREKEQ